MTGDDRAVLMAAAEQARSPSAAGRPRLGDLPRGVTDFVGRAEELAIVRKAAKLASSGDGPPPVVVVHGQPGLGKTAFAVRAAEELGDSFPDGRLYVDLRGVDPSPVAVGEVLLRLLRALDVSAGRIATGDDDRSAQLRTLLRDRRCLLVLDNARSEDQVRPLLPAGGRCLVIVTSRRALGGLEGVLRIELPLLAGFESAGLLSAIAAQAADPAVADQVQTLSRLCGHLPLALRIAGTRLAGRPQWTVENMIARLAGADRRSLRWRQATPGSEPRSPCPTPSCPHRPPRCFAASPTCRAPISPRRWRRCSPRPRRPTPRTTSTSWSSSDCCNLRASTGTGSTI
ncbi:NB-ARC domain-containing protein [Catellatospora coxensis]